VTSTITMTELLVPSYRDKDEHRVDEFYGLLSTYPNLRWIPPDWRQQIWRHDFEPVTGSERLMPCRRRPQFKLTRRPSSQTIQSSPALVSSKRRCWINSSNNYLEFDVGAE